MRIDSLHQAWAVRTERKQLAEALNSWFLRKGTEDISLAEQQRMSEFGKVRRKVRSPFISREQGIISTYDAYFKQASKTTATLLPHFLSTGAIGISSGCSRA